MLPVIEPFHKSKITSFSAKEVIQSPFLSQNSVETPFDKSNLRFDSLLPTRSRESTPSYPYMSVSYMLASSNVVYKLSVAIPEDAVWGPPLREMYSVDEGRVQVPLVALLVPHPSGEKMPYPVVRGYLFSNKYKSI